VRAVRSLTGKPPPDTPSGLPKLPCTRQRGCCSAR
jgi:hypothetical protein